MFLSSNRNCAEVSGVCESRAQEKRKITLKKKGRKSLCPEQLETKQESEAYGAKGRKDIFRKERQSAVSNAVGRSRK